MLQQLELFQHCEIKIKMRLWVLIFLPYKLKMETKRVPVVKILLQIKYSLVIRHSK